MLTKRKTPLQRAFKNCIKCVSRAKRHHPALKTVFVVVGVVMVWRGLWGLMDVYLFPDYPVLSFLTSTLVGLLLLFVVDSEMGDLE